MFASPTKYSSFFAFDSIGHVKFEPFSFLHSICATSNLLSRQWVKFVLIKPRGCNVSRDVLARFCLLGDLQTSWLLLPYLCANTYVPDRSVCRLW